VNLKRPRSSTTETVTTAYSSQVEPVLRKATVPATIAALVVAHVEMGADFPTSLVVATVILSVVLPKYRRVVVATLCGLYGLAFLLIGVCCAIFKRNDHGDHMLRGLAKVVSLVDGVALPDWADVRPPASGVTSTSAPAPALTGVAEPGSALSPALVSSMDLLPPARNAARSTNEPFFDSVLTDMAEKRPTGPIDIVDAQSAGRHAKPVAPEHAEMLATA